MASAIGGPQSLHSPTPSLLAPLSPGKALVPDLPVSPSKFTVALPTKAIPPFDLVCYRGEKTSTWSLPHLRLSSGMTVWEPWNLVRGVTNMHELWEYARKFFKGEKDAAFGTADGAAQYLRATGRAFALASARTSVGSFTSDKNYVIRVPNVRAFLLNDDLTVGERVDFADHTKVNKEYLVLNADNLRDATVLAFGHTFAGKSGTYEVTFLHDLPIRYVESCEGTPIAQLNPPVQTTWTAQDKMENAKMIKLLRPGGLGFVA